MFDTATGAMLWSGNWAIHPTFTPDGKTVYVTGNQGMDLQGFDARIGVQGLDAPVPGDVEGFGMMPDVNTLIALVEPGCVSTPDFPCSLSIEFLSVADGSVLRQFPLVPNTVLTGDGPLGQAAFRCSTAAGLCAVNLTQLNTATNLVSGGHQVQVWTTGGAMRQAIFTGANDLAISPEVSSWRSRPAATRRSTGSATGSWSIAITTPAPSSSRLRLATQLSAVGDHRSEPREADYQRRDQ